MRTYPVIEAGRKILNGRFTDWCGDVTLIASSRPVAGAPILTQGTDRTGGAAYTLVSPISYQVRRSSISSLFCI